MHLVLLVLAAVLLGKGCEGNVYDVNDGIQFASTQNYTDSAPQIDPNGYIMFCSCIGYFGNQMSYFLGVLSFALALNRTLILPPIIEYQNIDGIKPVLVPFEDYFSVDALQAFHRVITMETFMRDIAPVVWPYQKRFVFIHSGSGGCPNVRKEHPQGDLWKKYDINFLGCQFIDGLSYNLHRRRYIEEWQAKFPTAKFPVIALSSPPATFPVNKEDTYIQRYFKWSVNVRKRMLDFKRDKLDNQPYLAAHVRLGDDWKRTCQRIKGQGDQGVYVLVESPQCWKERNGGRLKYEMCFPDPEDMKTKIVLRAASKGVRKVFIGYDSAHTRPFRKLKELLAAEKHLTVVYGTEEDPLLDLALMEEADAFIANCVSAFSAVAKRERDHLGKRTDFWGFL